MDLMGIFSILYRVLLMIRHMWTLIIICIPEIFDLNTSHQFFDYMVTFMSLQHETQIQKVICTQKNSFKRSFKDF